jgi:peptidoglycan/LPS O-acetylase OafA/YrhL
MSIDPVLHPSPAAADRLHALDAVRAGALLLGVVFHATLSFMEPRFWVVGDVSTSPVMNSTYFVIHIFRMTVFFLIAGFFARMLLHRRGTGGFARNRARRILLPFLIFYPLAMVSTVLVIFWAASLSGEQSPPPPPITADTFPLTHLWFLYWLLVLYVVALVVRGLVTLIDRDGRLRERFVDPLVKGIVDKDLTPIVFGAPLCLAFFLKSDWLSWSGVPAAENGVIPNSAAFVAYGTAFGVGWLLQRQVEVIAVWERRCMRNLAIAVVLTGVALWMAGTYPMTTPAPFDGERYVYAVVYTLAIWFWTMALIGLALRFLSRDNPAVRYVADGSYWIYIVHLPLVMALQAAFSQLPVSWFVKYVLILVIAFPVLLLSYRYLVRDTFIGTLLNGRRYPRKVAQPVTPVSGLAAVE